MDMYTAYERIYKSAKILFKDDITEDKILELLEMYNYNPLCLDVIEDILKSKGVDFDE